MKFLYFYKKINIMLKKIYLVTLLFIVSTFFSLNANSQFRYRTFVKKQIRKSDSGKNKKGNHRAYRPFVYKYV